jgi:hypothetical protein
VGTVLVHVEEALGARNAAQLNEGKYLEARPVHHVVAADEDGKLLWGVVDVGDYAIVVREELVEEGRGILPANFEAGSPPADGEVFRSELLGGLRERETGRRGFRVVVQLGGMRAVEELALGL